MKTCNSTSRERMQKRKTSVVHPARWINTREFYYVFVDQLPGRELCFLMTIITILTTQVVAKVICPTTVIQSNLRSTTNSFSHFFCTLNAFQWLPQLFSDFYLSHLTIFLRLIVDYIVVQAQLSTRKLIGIKRKFTQKLLICYWPSYTQHWLMLLHFNSCYTSSNDDDNVFFNNVIEQYELRYYFF